MANKAGIINADTGVIVGVPDALVQVGGVWTIAATAPGTVPASRQINTTAPLTGGGDLSADRTLAIAAATAGNDGYMTTTQVATLATAASTAGAALPKAGGTMTGAIDMGSQKITSLGTPTATTDAATKGYVDTAVVGLLDLKGSIDCSANPNYPAALKGDVWVISVAGLIGGASGISVQAGDAILALADNAGGTQAAVGSSWSILQANLVGALLAANNLSDVGNTATARNNLGLGTAATQNSSAFATAAQGTLAGTAVQRAGDTMTGNLQVNARIGIGAAPTTTFDIFNALGNADFRLRGNNQSTVVFDVASGTTGHFLYGYGSVPMQFATNGILRMTIGSAGNVILTSALTVQSGGINVTGNSQVVGNLGVGATPTTQFDVYAGAGSNANIRIRGNAGSNTLDIAVGPAAHYIYGYSAIPMDFATNGVSRMVIASAGGITVKSSLQIGTSGTAITQQTVYTPTLTPAAVSAGAPAEQTFTVTGLATTDTVTVNAPGAAVFNARVSAANTLAITFMPPATGSYTPPAGTYRIVAIRS